MAIAELLWLLAGGIKGERQPKNQGMSVVATLNSGVDPGGDATALREEGSLEPLHRRLITERAGKSLVEHIEKVLTDGAQFSSRLGWEFRNGLYSQLRSIDARIPGVGMHFVVWNGPTPQFPFPGGGFEGVLRTLRYIPYYLAAETALQMVSRSVAYYSGAHVEQCLKTFNRRSKDPLGKLVRTRSVRKRLGEGLAGALQAYGPSWNRAKHEYETGTPDSVISIDSAIGNYFAARILGAEVLEAVGHLDQVVELAKSARRRSEYFVTGSLPEPPSQYYREAGRRG